MIENNRTMMYNPWKTFHILTLYTCKIIWSKMNNDDQVFVKTGKEGFGAKWIMIIN